MQHSLTYIKGVVRIDITLNFTEIQLFTCLKSVKNIKSTKFPNEQVGRSVIEDGNFEGKEF